MFDFNEMGRLLELARDIDTDDLVDLSNKVDLPELLSIIHKLDDDQLRRFESEVRAAASGDQGADSSVRTQAVVREEPWAYLPFRRIAVLGAGTMGAQIAAHFANAGLEVLLLDLPAKDDDPNKIVKQQFAAARKARPDPFFDDAAANRVSLGNFDDDFDRLRDVEWIIEAVVERLDIKRSVMERIEAASSDDAIISTNTSGIPIAEIAEGRSASFRGRFLGTHFFNPPRYLKLLELIPTPNTRTEVIDRVAQFGRIHLGKGIVVAKDVPYFIGNRVGVYGQLQAMRYFENGDYTIEEIDLLTGPLTGRPKSATFRTADIVGLDVLKQVTENLYEKAVTDESRGAFRVPQIINRLVERGSLGSKSGGGFYRKEGKIIKSVDRSSLEYSEPEDIELGDVEKLKAKPLPERLNALFDHDGRAGMIFRETTLDLLGYSARRIPEITENPADVDRAIRWGFGWEAGPFELWDILGFARVYRAMKESDIVVPEWIETMKREGVSSFYHADAARAVFHPVQKRHVPDPRPADQIRLDALRDETSNVLWKNDEAVLIDVGDGVAVFEFRSRGNALGRKVMEGLNDAIDLVEADSSLRGLVIGNEGKNFAVGANLFEVVKALEADDHQRLERYLRLFQNTIQRVRFARKPVVVAVHQRVLGGACEMVMACPHPVASAESYIGLVELGVGLIPAGSGSMHLAALAADRAPSGHPSEIQANLQMFFENVAMARVSESAERAKAMGYVAPCTAVVMNDDRRLFVAKERVRALSEEGYRPPPKRHEVKVLGRPARAAIEVQLQQYVEGRFISEYDRDLASQLAYVMTGGDLSGPDHVTEDYLLELEREVFLRLLQDERSTARIKHMLEKGKPLRN